NANLNTLAFDKNGIVWFTGQSGVYGRADPATGRVNAWKTPKGPGPYGIAATPGGDIWYASLAGDHIAKIDTTSGAVTVVEPPKPGVGPRRIWSDSKRSALTYAHASALLTCKQWRKPTNYRLNVSQCYTA